MITRKSEMQIDHQNVRNGNGDIEFRRIIRTPEELCSKGRLFSHMVLQPGQSVGYHQHVGDMEWYYILRGHGEYNDNGRIEPVGPGDVTVCHDGEFHGLVNTCSETLEMIALVLYTA